MGKYKSLISNTLLFGLSTFSSKVLVLLLMPLYTSILSPAEYGVGGLVFDTCNFIVPLISLCIHEAVIRYGMDNTKRKRDIFSTAILTIFAGYALMFAFYPLIKLVVLVDDYMLLIYIYTLTSALRSTITHFVRASGFVRMFALDGLFTTAMTVGMNVLLLVKFQMGITGYVLSTIIADAVSSLSLVLILRLYRFFHISGLNRNTAREMLRYCIPLVPTAIFWWVTNLSDRYFIAVLLGEDVTGIYNVSYKVPTTITLVSTIFIQAWQLSAFNEYKSRDGTRFYSTVFKSYYTLVFLAASGLILLVQPITTLLTTKPEYYVAWRYMPFLVLAVACSCMVTFLGTIYNAAKKNGMVTVTTLVGAVVNVALNALLIPRYGANGAAFATFISFLIVFIIRAVDTRKYAPIKMQPLRICANLVLLLLQCWVALSDMKYRILLECVIFLLILICNFGFILFLLQHFLDLLPGHRRHASEEDAP